MKKSMMLLFLVCCNVTFSQIGKLHLKKSKLIIGKENTYVYEPPRGVEIPKEAEVRIIYNDNYDFTGGTASLIKKGKGYEFTIQVPDSIKYFVAAIIDKKKIVDNNMDMGYDLFLNSSDPAEMGKAMAARIELINYANRTLASKLKLKLDSKPETLLAEYNKLYAKYPKMKEDKSYAIYLFLKEPTDKENTKAEMLAFAQKCEKINSEDYWITASSLYNRLEMMDKSKQMREQILAKYPKGRVAADAFFFEFLDKPEKTEAYVLEQLNLYKTKFDNVPARNLEYFYQSLLQIYLANKDFQKIDQYESLLLNKIAAAGIYNEYAWKLSGENLTTPSKDIDYAEKISKRSLDIVSNLQKESDSPADFDGSYKMYADTYGLILYKQNRFDEAFQILDKLKELNALNTGGKECYAATMEKVKGLDVAKIYIEEELSKGTKSKVLLAQLETIYGKLNLPLASFNAFKAKSNEAIKNKATAEMVKLYGSNDAINFSLKNLDGKVINLSDLKGKVVVLDFWATWCGPCKASFPAMQELVTKYKDKNVEFLFVDTWERGKDNEVTEKVTQFISDNKYSFNVVFGYDDAVTAKYKIQGIPTKIVIDKKGKLVSFGGSEENLISLIEEQLSL